MDGDQLSAVRGQTGVLAGHRHELGPGVAVASQDMGLALVFRGPVVGESHPAEVAAEARPRGRLVWPGGGHL